MLRSPWFPCVMSLKRFKVISQFLHFADNALALSHDNPSYDRLWKIWPVTDSIQRQSQKTYTPGKCVSVDESMIGTRGHLSFIQYMPKKLTKWGIKVWVCSESVTGYIHKFQVYTGKDTECTNGLAYGVVMYLLGRSARGRESTLSGTVRIAVAVILDTNYMLMFENECI